MYEYIYIYICLYVYMSICPYVYMYICIYVYVYVSVYVCMVLMPFYHKPGHRAALQRPLPHAVHIELLAKA